eukprot:197616_1
MFGFDNRTKFDHIEAMPWSAVGQVFTETHVCSGVMVGPSLMLTAQSCINRQPDGTLGWLRFVPAFLHGGSRYGAADAVEVTYDHRIPDLDAMTIDDAAFNYAVFKLDAPIGDTTVVRYWPADVYGNVFGSWLNDQALWDHLGYAHDVESGLHPFWVDLFSIDSVSTHTFAGSPQAYLMYTTSLDVGSSWQIGGPVVGYHTDVENYPLYPIVIGVLSATTDSANLVSGGPGMVAMINVLLETDN